MRGIQRMGLASICYFLNVAAFAYAGEDNAKTLAKLAANEKDLSRQFRNWQEQVVKLHAELERSKLPTERQLGSRIKDIFLATSELDLEVRKLTEITKLVKHSNLNDLDILAKQSELITRQLAQAKRMLEDGLIVRDQRLAFEALLKSFQEIEKERSGLDDDNEKHAIKKQAKIMEQTIDFADHLRREGEGKGRLGDALKRVQSNLSRAVEFQRESIKHLQTKEARAAKESRLRATGYLDSANENLNEIVFLLRLRENHSMLTKLAGELSETRISVKQTQERLAEIAASIAKNPERKPTREDQVACLKLADSLRDPVRRLSELSDQIRKSGQSSITADMLAVASADLRMLMKPIGLSRVGPETQASANKMLGNVDAIHKHVKQSADALATIEAGQIGNLKFDKALTLAVELGKLESGYRQFAREAEDLWRSNLRPLRSIFGEKKRSDDQESRGCPERLTLTAASLGRLFVHDFRNRVEYRRRCSMPEDKVMTATGLIRKTRDVLGGSARIGDRRIAVWMLVQARRLGMTDEAIRTRYRPPLTVADLDAAWRHYEAHPTEIGRAIRENEEA